MSADALLHAVNLRDGREASVRKNRRRGARFVLAVYIPSLRPVPARPTVLHLDCEDLMAALAHLQPDEGWRVFE